MRAAWIAKRFDGKASQYFGLLPRARFAIKPVPDDLAPFYTVGPRRSGRVPGQYLQLAETAALQLDRADAARVRTRARLPDADRAGAQAAAGISPAHLYLRLRRGLGAVLRDSWAWRWACTTRPMTASAC